MNLQIVQSSILFTTLLFLLILEIVTGEMVNIPEHMITPLNTNTCIFSSLLLFAWLSELFYLIFLVKRVEMM